MHLHLNLYNAHGNSLDDEGADFADLAEAKTAAIAGIRSLLSAEVMEGELNLIGHLDIVDPQGALLHSVRFTEALNIISP